MAFGALAVATVFDLGSTSVVVMPVTVLAAVLILRTGQNPKLHGDAAIAMLSVGSLAVGYLVMNLFSTSANISGECVQHAVWLDLDSDTDQSGGVAVRGDVCGCGGSVYLFVQPYFCSDV